MRQTLRRIVSNPGFTVITVLTLALGIGANTAIFSIVNAVLLNPVPFEDPEELVIVHEQIPNLREDPIPISAPDVLEFKRQSQTVEGVSAVRTDEFELSGAGQAERILGVRVSATLFPLLRVDPILGRAFTEEEDVSRHPVAILSHGLWQRRFGGSDGVIGQTVNLDRKPYTVIGVMPAGFDFRHRTMSRAPETDVWVPMSFTEGDLNNIADNFNFTVVARLRPGVSREQANQEMQAIAKRVRETYPPAAQEKFDLTAGVIALNEIAVRDTRTPLLLLLGAVGLVLLVVCANVANLFLAQATSRSKEMSIRLALGAGRGQIVRQLLAESVPVALLGGLLGLAFASWCTDLLLSVAPAGIIASEAVGIDLTVLGFALGLSLAVSVIFAIVPALTASQANPNAALREGGRSNTAGRERHRLRSAFVVAEIAFAFLLLTGAGLLVRSFASVLETDPGFQSSQVLTMNVSLPRSNYPAREQILGFHERAIADIRSLPGVTAAGVGTDLPLGASWTKLITAEGRTASDSDGMPITFYSEIQPGYMEALGIRLLDGRFFNDFDRDGAEQTVIINETLAKRYWGSDNPLGERLKLALPEADFPWLTVVGLVADVKGAGLDVPAEPHAYGPIIQQKYPAARVSIVVRGHGAPADLTASVAARIAQIDPELALADVQTMEQVVASSLEARRFLMLLLAVFAAAAVALAAIGIYGVLAHAVTERTHEIGIRVALGAQRSGVYRIVLGEGFKLALIGVVIGLGGAFALTRVLASQLYGVEATDTVTFLAAPALVGVVVLVACLAPAVRATRVDPMVALRYE